ncbi:MAG: nicotinate (nicotinamide) nucleotide adenylyltransferase [Alphaproteobacteria bacterium]|nr:nicotinate (nicotinamide) nucleotide adenylyltransferase [Alphaproteobacteria bacterium]
MATVKKIGVLGGSFNPAHNGHLEISCQTMEKLNLDEIWWIITSKNPFKDAKTYLSLDKRIKIAKEVIKDNKIKIHSFEEKINSPYTVDLINHLKQSYDDNFVWIMGSDNINDFKKWKSYETILNNIKIVICNRPNYEFNSENLQDFLGCGTNLIFKDEINDFMKNDNGIVLINSTNNYTSSTKIRKNKIYDKE